MFCKNCGTVIDDKSFVCPHCGVKVEDDKPAGQTLVQKLVGYFKLDYSLSWFNTVLRMEKE